MFVPIQNPHAFDNNPLWQACQAQCLSEAELDEIIAQPRDPRYEWDESFIHPVQYRDPKADYKEWLYHLAEDS